MGTILIAVVCALSVIALIVGLVKGYTKTNVWGVAVLLTVIISRLIIANTNSFGGSGVIIIAVAFGILLAFIILLNILKRTIAKGCEKAKQLSYYKKYDEREENTELILNAIDDGDKKAYKKYSKRKIKQTAGGWGIVDRVLGGVFNCLNIALTLGIILSVFILVVQLAQIASLTALFEDVLANGVWQNVGAKLVFDLLFVSIAYLCMSAGYKSGISSGVCVLIIIGLLGLAVYLSYHLATEVEVFVSLAESLANGALSSLSQTLSSFGIKGTGVAQIIIMVCLFILFLLVVILIAIFLPKFVKKFRESAPFRVVDGVFGAVVVSVIIFGVLMVVGGILYTLNDLSIMGYFNEYMNNSYITNSIYAYNPLSGVFGNLPVRSWFSQPVETPVETPVE
jgi:hypothetical protein